LIFFGEFQVIHHIPKNIIEMTYGIELPKAKEGQRADRLPLAEELCSSYSSNLLYFLNKKFLDF
jgi:hypothetical protein